jgi:molybdopterin synthase catalytic subunit
MITDKPIRLEEHLTGDFDPNCGAVVTFSGVVRSINEGRRVTGIFYDCYHEMAEAEIGRLVEDIVAECGVRSLKVIHRVGELTVGELSLLVLASSEHRREAFEATQRVIDEIKRRVPIWKKERYADAPAEWL